MLSYQHAYHAGNLADVHKHAALAAMLDYMTRKPKPLTYLETHAGRGLYDLAGREAARTGEAAAGIARAEALLPEAHPYRRVLAATRAAHGPAAYPGSPLVAQALLRSDDRLHLAELHPAEYAALSDAVAPGAPKPKLYHRDGLALAASLLPPEPRRGMALIDPSWETAADYTAIPKRVAALARSWPVGVIVLWYPLLREPRHHDMLLRLRRAAPEALCHEVGFPPARDGHRMIGSGLFVINPPFGLAQEIETLDAVFAALAA